MKRYDTCTKGDGDCASCSLSSYGKDCKNNPVNKVAYYRQLANMTQQQLADKAGAHVGQIKKFEYDQRPVGGSSLRLGLAIADALGVDAHELL